MITLFKNIKLKYTMSNKLILINKRLFCPSVSTMWIGAYIVKSHFLFSSSCLSLEKYSFPMKTNNITYKNINN